MMLLSRTKGLLKRRMAPSFSCSSLTSVRRESTTSASSTTTPIRNVKDDEPSVVLQRRGDHPYGTREYRLVLRAHPGIKVASLRAHRNIIFGACMYDSQGQDVLHHNKGSTASTSSRVQLSRVCLPLLDKALEDANIEGEQPQALATLHGLCEWVTGFLKSSNTDGQFSSQTLRDLLQSIDTATYDALRAIATGIPREGHSVVGRGTYSDGQLGWEALAQEFVNQGLAEEVALYQARGAAVVEMEYLADTHPDYLKSAGGTMARLFFLCELGAPIK